MSFASSSRDLSASRWAGVADSSIVDTSQSVHSRRTAILPRVGSRRISVSIRPTRRVLRMGKRCPFRGWKGCRTSAHPKDSLDAWVVRSNRREGQRPFRACRTPRRRDIDPCRSASGHPEDWPRSPPEASLMSPAMRHELAMVIPTVNECDNIAPRNLAEHMVRFQDSAYSICAYGCPLLKHCGKQVVEKQNDYGAGDHRAGSRLRDTLRRGCCIITLVHSDQAACDTGDAAFHNPLVDVGQADTGAHLRPEAARIDTHDLHTQELGAINADQAEYGREQRHRDHAAQKPRHDHALYRVDRHHFHGR